MLIDYISDIYICVCEEVEARKYISNWGKYVR